MAEQKYANTPAETGQAVINTYTITPNGGGEVIKVSNSQNLGGFAELQYFESIFDTTIRATSKIIDVSGPTGGDLNIVDKAKLTSGEKIKISLQDGYKNKLDLDLILKNYNYVQDTKGVLVDLNMWSPDMIENEDTKKRVIKQYEGLISDSVTDILKNTLGTSLKVEVDTSLGMFTFQGNKATATPYDQCLWLASRCVPDFSGAKGKLAGYLLYQTSDSIKFKSIDKLFSESPKAKFIYNEKVEEVAPPEYDAKIMDYQFNKSMDIENMMKGGTFSQSESITVNPFKTEYKEAFPFDAISQNMKKNNAGKDIPIIAEALGFANRTFKINMRPLDTGQLKPIDKKQSKEQNLLPDEIMRQARARYNQLNTSNLKIVIPLNVKLHAGDIIEVTFPENKGGKAPLKLTKRKSGRYMIESLSHKIALANMADTANTTALTLIRDTEGKK